MTATLVDDAALGSALAMLWQRHRQTNLDRISLLETTTADVLRSKVDGDSVSEAGSAAHKLAGSLGTFGFDAGSRAALEVEYLLREVEIDGRLLAEAVTELRASVQEESNHSIAAFGQAGSTETVSNPDASIQVISRDAILISRLAVAAAAIGLSTSSSADVPPLDAMSAELAVVVIDDGPLSPWTPSGLLDSIAALADMATVIVLTEHDTFEDRTALARSGAAGVIPRSQGPAQTVSFLAEALARQGTAQSIVLSLNASSNLEDSLHRALAGSDCHLDIRDNGLELWDALDEQGADLVVVGFSGSRLSGPDLCRMIRAHPCWHRLPVVVMGGRSRRQLDESFAAGADDYLSVGTSSHDLGVRLQHHLSASRLSEARSDFDPVAGTGNRMAAERSLDRLLGMSMQNGDPFALALVTIDHFEQIRTTEGTAVGDAVVRRLGSHLLGAFQGEDVIGRWTDDGFAIGVHGASRDEASERIANVLEAIATEGVSTTSGGLAHYTFSAGIAAAPADGSSLGSLERICETALRRAAVAETNVVVSGERPVHDESTVLDVVLVEDDDSMADVIEHALGLRNYEFVRFSDGADAARELGQGTVRAKVVLLDVGLPSLDGFGVLQVLRSQGILDETRVIMLTARSSEGEVIRAISLGATEHITKPFSIPVLLARLDQTHVGALA
jgi:diguanylate cyclase (GGDEF)-like protein